MTAGGISGQERLEPGSWRRFEGETIIVTGSAGGIGRELALLLAREGAQVVVTSRQKERLEGVAAGLQSAGAAYLAFAGDLRNLTSADALMRATIERFGRIDTLVNNAAGLFFAPVEAISENGWRAVLDSCLSTAFLCAKAAFPYLRDQGHGSIWNISSVASFRPHPGAAHYAAAKAGMNNLTETLAFEWGRYGVQVNGVAFGPVLTENSRFNEKRHRESIERELPRGRIAGPDEAAGILRDLIAVRSTYFTGEMIRVDGGFRGVLANPRDVA